MEKTNSLKDKEPVISLNELYYPFFIPETKSIDIDPLIEGDSEQVLTLAKELFLSVPLGEIVKEFGSRPVLDYESSANGPH